MRKVRVSSYVLVSLLTLSVGRLALAAPVIAAVSPVSGATSGGFSTTISGNGFGSNGTVTIGGRSCTATSWSDTEIECIVPEGQGANLPLIVTNDLGESGSLFFSYDPPRLDSILPSEIGTSGGTVLTLTGSNFGLTPSVTIAGSGCTPSAPSNHSEIRCLAPAGEGSAPEVTVEVAGQTRSRTDLLSYSAPRIDDVVPATVPTAGGTLITLAGGNFGAEPRVTVAGRICPVTGTSTDAEITCTVPPGEGAPVAVEVTVADQSTSTDGVLGYSPPTLDVVTPADLPTAGGALLTLIGSNFGLNASVTVGGQNCGFDGPGSSRSHDQLVCVGPAGEGFNLPLVVNVAGQQASGLVISYRPPRIDAVQATRASTAGGDTLTIIGENFGLSPSVTVGGQSCPPVEAASHSSVACALPEGEGVDLPLVVNVSGQSANASFSYDPPTIDEIRATSFPTVGGETLTLSGESFGLAPRIVFYNGAGIINAPTCTLDSRDHGELTCPLPSGQGTGVQATVEVGGQTSSAALFSYDPPEIDQLSPATAPAVGGTILTLNGRNFGVGPTVFVGGSSCEPRATSDSEIQCVVPAGLGLGLDVAVYTSGQRSAPNALFSYQAPVCPTGEFSPDGGTGCFPCENPPECARCGDGIKAASEACEDGNLFADDGCTETCATAPGWSCEVDPDSGLTVVCDEILGDGLVVGEEQCDTGDDGAGDGCSGGLIEEGFACNAAEPSRCTRLEVCGDGVLDGGEDCDDGNAELGDGCTDRCDVEAGFECVTPTAAPTRCIRPEPNAPGEASGDPPDDGGCTGTGVAGVGMATAALALLLRRRRSQRARR